MNGGAEDLQIFLPKEGEVRERGRGFGCGVVGSDTAEWKMKTANLGDGTADDDVALPARCRFEERYME